MVRELSFKIICTMGIGRRDKVSAFFHIITDPSNAKLLWYFLLFYMYVLVLNFCAVSTDVCFHIFGCVWVIEWPPTASHSGKYTCICFLSKYLNVNLVFPHYGFWSGNSFLIVPFPDHCLLLIFYYLKK